MILFFHSIILSARISFLLKHYENSSRTTKIYSPSRPSPRNLCVGSLTAHGTGSAARLVTNAFGCAVSKPKRTAWTIRIIWRWWSSERAFQALFLSFPSYLCGHIQLKDIRNTEVPIVHVWDIGLFRTHHISQQSLYGVRINVALSCTSNLFALVKKVAAWKVDALFGLLTKLIAALLIINCFSRVAVYNQI